MRLLLLLLRSST